MEHFLRAIASFLEGGAVSGGRSRFWRELFLGEGKEAIYPLDGGALPLISVLALHGGQNTKTEI